MTALRVGLPSEPIWAGTGAAGSAGRRSRGSLLPAVGAFGHEPGPSDANDAPECREDDDGEREGMSCHGESRGARPRLG